VSFFLRLLGITNATIWFGASVFLLVGVWPAFYSPDMLKFLPPSHAGAAAQVVLDRFFSVQYWCGSVAIAHGLLEWLYAGRPLQRWINWLVLGILSLALIAGLGIEPKLKHLHIEVYGMRSTPQQRVEAGKAFRVWQGVLQLANVAVAFSLWLYTWEVTNPGETARFLSPAKLRG
jgi:hypothetical protein